MTFDPRWSVQHVAQEVARLAIEGLGWSMYQEMRASFAELVQAKSADRQVQTSLVGFLLYQAAVGVRHTDETALQMIGCCLLWLAGTEMREWTIWQLIVWALQWYPTDEEGQE